MVNQPMQNISDNSIQVNGFPFRGSNYMYTISASLFNRGYSERKEFAPLGANSFL